MIIPIVSFGQDTIPMTKILNKKEAYKKKMMKLKEEYKVNHKDKIKPGNKINNNPIVPIMYSASLSDSFMLCSDLIHLYFLQRLDVWVFPPFPFQL